MGDNTQMELVQTSGFKLMSPDDRNRFLADMQKFTTSLNQAPTNITKKTINGKELTYVAISVIEKDLDKVFFGMVQYEILWSKQVLNEFEVAARIKVFHPILMQWLNYDGIGAALIQQTSGTRLENFHQHKLATALKLAAPNAYAEAIKNAAKKIGKRFGADLMRDIEDEYSPYNIPDAPAHKGGKVVPQSDEVNTLEMDSPEVISTLKTKKDLLRAYNNKQLSSEKYNELLKKMLTKTEMP